MAVFLILQIILSLVEFKYNPLVISENSSIDMIY